MDRGTRGIDRTVENAIFSITYDGLRNSFENSTSVDKCRRAVLRYIWNFNAIGCSDLINFNIQK